MFRMAYLTNLDLSSSGVGGASITLVGWVVSSLGAAMTAVASAIFLSVGVSLIIAIATII